MMYYEKKPLRFFSRRFHNDTAVIVGSGPTKFDYKDLKSLYYPAFLLNDTIALEHLTNDPSFFYTSSPDPTNVRQPKNKNWYKLIKKSHCLIKRSKKKLDGICQICEYSSSGPYTEFDLIYNTTINEVKDKRLSVLKVGFPNWVFDRDYLIRNNCLFSHQGSITALIHFIWFCGFKNAILIGCGPTLHTRHDSRILSYNGGRQPAWDLPIILENQAAFLNHFEIKAEYLGDFPK